MSNDQIRLAMNDVIRYLTANPDEARSEDKPATATIEHGLRCNVEGPGGARLVSDMPRAVGGGGTAPSPGWLMRAALAACDATVIAMRAAQAGITLTTLEVTISSESDDRGLLGMDEAVPAGPYFVSTLVRIGAQGVPPERLREIVKWAENHSPVANVVQRAIPSEVHVEII